MSEAFKLATTRAKPWKQVSETSFLSHPKVPPLGFSPVVVNRHGDRGHDVTTGSSCCPQLGRAVPPPNGARLRAVVTGVDGVVTKRTRSPAGGALLGVNPVCPRVLVY